MLVVFALPFACSVTSLNTDIYTSAPASSAGVRILGTTGEGQLGYAVSGLGDVDGDKICDFIVSAPYVNTNAGAIYVIFGRYMAQYVPSTDLFSLPTQADTGFKIYGASSNAQAGTSLGAAGDVNFDGVMDIIIGAPLPSTQGGAAYIIFGRKVTGGAAPFGDIYLSAIGPNTPEGFRIIGAAPDDRAGFAVDGAGDINGDGVDDVIVGAYQADFPSFANAGITYVIFGRNIAAGGTVFTDIVLFTLSSNPGLGFRILGEFVNGCSGYSVSKAGDVNGDKIGDIIIGAIGATGGGAAYVIFGRDVAHGAEIFTDMYLSTITSSTGFKMSNAVAGDGVGTSVSNAGDINGDGLGDVLIGAPEVALGMGCTYVVFGRDVAHGALAFTEIPLGNMAGTPSVGFRIIGAGMRHSSGHAVSSAGDMNADGVCDILIGAPMAESDPNSQTPGFNPGVAYVIFGRDVAHGATPFGDIVLSTIITGSTDGFRVLSINEGDNLGSAVSAIGDVNGDGGMDINIAIF